MSTTVDQRVVEMQFDNKHFEQDVSQTMSTLDKLKQKLNLTGSAKGLQDVGNAAKKVDMSPLANGVENVRMKFSAMEVIGVTALANITNSAVNAGKRIVSALTIDPIKTGLSEYETQINSTQTILANVGHKGKTLDDVNAALDELNTYADKTIYNFTEMTRNIGLFTNAGVGLDESVSAIKGFSNAAAMAGTDATRTAGAMYQLSQAMSSGTVKLMDWRSLEQANITGERFQETIKTTARAHGIAIDDMIKKEGSLRDTLHSGWLTADLMAEALDHYTLSTTEMTEAEQKASREKLKLKGYTDEQIDSLFKLGTEATDAATKVKTFSQLWGVLTESAQSGWSRTWKLIIGDFEQAKSILTPLANFLTGFIDKMSDARNRILEIALHFTEPWAAITDKLGNIKKAVEPIEKVMGTLEEFQDIVNRVWMGEFNNWGDNPDRRDLLTAAGYDPRVVQYLVNLGEESWHAGKVYKLSMEEIEAAHKHYGLTMTTTSEDVEKANAGVADSIYQLDDAKLKDLGLTEEEIKLYRALESEAKRQGVTMAQLVDEMSSMTGRERLVEALKNIGQSIVEVFSIAKSAYKEIFNPPGVEELGIRLFGIIRSFQQWTENLKASIVAVDAEGKATGELTETGEKLKRTFKGVFAIFHILTTLICGPLKLAFRIITGLLKALDIPVLDVTASLGDALVAFDNWLTSALDFENIFRKLFGFFKEFPTHIKNLWNSFKQSKIFIAALPLFQALRDKIIAIVNAVKETKAFKKVVEFFTPFLDGIKSWWKGLKEAENIPKYLFDGLWKGIQNGASRIWETISNVIVKLIEIVKDILGIHSPSTVFMAIGGFIIAGLLIGLTNAFPGVWDAIGGFVDNILAIVGKVDWGGILTAVISTGAMASIYKFMSFLKGIGDMLGGVGDVLSGTGKILEKSAGAVKKVVNNVSKVVKSFSKVLDGVAWSLKAGAIKDFAISIGILAGAIAVLAIVTKLVGPGALWQSVAIIVILAGVLAGMAYALEKMSGASASIGKDGVQLKGFSTMIIQIGLCMLMLAAVMKIVGGMDWGDLAKGGALILAFGGLVAGLLWASKLAGGDPIKSAAKIAKISALIKSVGTTLLLMAIVAKIAGGMDPHELIQGILGIAAFVTIITALIWATQLAGSEKKLASLGKMIFAVAGAISMMAIVAKIIGSMDSDELIQGILGISAFATIVGALIWATTFAGGEKQLANVGKTIFAIGAAIALLVIAAKILATLNPDDMKKGLKGILVLAVIVAALMYVTSLMEGDAKKVGLTLLSVAGAIAILAVVAMLLGMIEEDQLKKGLQVVAVLAGIMGALILVSSKASYANKTIIALAILIGVLAVAMIALSFIPWQNLIAPVIAMGVVIGLLAIPLNQLSKFKHGAKAMPMVLGLALIVGILGAVMIWLSYLPWQQSIAAAGGMSLVLLALAGAFKIIASSGEITKLAPTLITMAVLIGIVGGVMLLLSKLPNTNAAIAAAALSVTLLALAGTMKILSTMQSIKPTVVATLLILVGVIAVIGTVMSLLGGMGGTNVIMSLIAIAAALGILIVALNLMQNTIAGSAALLIAAAALAVLAPVLIKLGSMSLAEIGKSLLMIAGVFVVLGLAGLILQPLVPVILALCGALALLGIACVAIGAGVLMLGSGLTMIAAAGTDAALALVAIVSGIASLLPHLATQIGLFIINLCNTIAGGADAICEAVTVIILAVVDALVEAVPYLVNGVMVLLISVLESLITYMPTVVTLLVKLITTLLYLLVEHIPALLEAVFVFVAALLDGIATNITRIIDPLVKLFGAIFQGIAAVIGPIIQTVIAPILTILKDLVVGIVEAIAPYIPQLTEMFTTITTVIADAITKIIEAIAPFLPDIQRMVDSICNIFITLLEQIAPVIDSITGLVRVLGDVIIGIFSSVESLLSTLCTSICDILETFGETVKDVCDGATEVLGGIEGVFDAAFGGIADVLDSVGGAIQSVLEGIAGVIESVGNAALNTGTGFEKMAGAISRLSGVGVTNIAGILGSIATGLAEINEYENDLEDVTDAMTLLGGGIEHAAANIAVLKRDMGEVSSTLTAMKSAITDTASVFSSASGVMKTAGGELMDNIVNGLNEKKPRLLIAAKSAMVQFIAAIEVQQSKAKKASTALVTSCASAISKKASAFKSAAKDLVKGFANGITENTFLAVAKAKAMANAAEEAAKKALDINSPSKVFKKIGSGVPEGFAMGIGSFGSSIKNAVYDMSDTALSAVSRSISRISDAINSDIDAQPTIRPVLDLSDVRSGVGALNGMLDMDSAVGVRANVTAINSMMNNRVQNGSNAEVISAIDKLRDSIGKIGGDTYQINGVTYDDGSNITDAVRTIVRAARIERRV